MNGRLRPHRAIDWKTIDFIHSAIRLKSPLLMSLLILLALLAACSLFHGKNFALAQENKKEQQNAELEKANGIISTVALYGTVISTTIIVILIILWIILGWRNLKLRLSQVEEQLRMIQSKQGDLTNIKTEAQKINSLELRLEIVEERLREPTIPPRQELQPRITREDLTQKRESPLQVFCRLYNSIVDGANESDKLEFRKLYQPVRIGVANAMERRENPKIEPNFKTETNGDYYAVSIEGNMFYAVVPRFDLTFQESSYGPGAMGQVFDCSNYNPQLRYRRVKVVKPAFFEFDSAKQGWTIKDKGELDLGQGEP